MSAPKEIEIGTSFRPKFDEQGLIPVIAQDAATGQVLMVAYMNDEALKKTIELRQGVYYSRSRKKLWFKGEESGAIQRVEEILTDCDQDTIILKVRVEQGQCHVGFQSCFYRRVSLSRPDQLEFIAKPVYNPADVYKKP
jgi:phosphoribosyl-AMP cyclohydrolase